MALSTLPDFELLAHRTVMGMWLLIWLGMCWTAFPAAVTVADLSFLLLACTVQTALLTLPVTLNGPPKSFCSALIDFNQCWSALVVDVPTEMVVSLGRMFRRKRCSLPQIGVCGSVVVVDGKIANAG